MKIAEISTGKMADKLATADVIQMIRSNGLYITHAIVNNEEVVVISSAAMDGGILIV